MEQNIAKPTLGIILQKSTVPIFVARFILPLFAGAVVLLALANPMGFHRTQRITRTVALIFAAYFVGHTIYKSAPKATDLALPLVVEFHVSNARSDKEKLITIKNPGRLGIEDIRIEGVKYIFEGKSFKAYVLKLESFSQLGLLTTIPRVPAGHDSKPIDMSKLRGIELHTWEEAVQAQLKEESPEPFRTYYCLRFTFRDERTKEKLACYKVTSDFYSSPLLIEDDVNPGGGVFHPVYQDIPDVIKAHARDRFGTETREYKP